MALSLGPIFDKKYPITKSYKKHSKFGCPGTDFGTPMGTPLRAVFDGTIFSGVNPDIPGKIDIKEDWGKYQWLTSSENKAVKVAYTHLSKFKVKSGKVKKGQIISYSGNSGYSFGSHLHFALSYYGKCIDPLNSPNVVKWTQMPVYLTRAQKTKICTDTLGRNCSQAALRANLTYEGLLKRAYKEISSNLQKLKALRKITKDLNDKVIKLEKDFKIEMGAYVIKYDKLVVDLRGEIQNCHDHNVEISGELADLDQLLDLPEGSSSVARQKAIQNLMAGKKPPDYQPKTPKNWWEDIWKWLKQRRVVKKVLNINRTRKEVKNV